MGRKTVAKHKHEWTHQSIGGGYFVQVCRICGVTKKR